RTSLSFLYSFLLAPPTTQIYTLSLHDALPIFSGSSTPSPTSASPTPNWPNWSRRPSSTPPRSTGSPTTASPVTSTVTPKVSCTRSEEHTSELQSRENLVCRLLLEKKNIKDLYT